MTTKTVREFGTEAADIFTAFFFRNGVVIGLLASIALIALASS